MEVSRSRTEGSVVMHKLEKSGKGLGGPGEEMNAHSVRRESPGLRSGSCMHVIPIHRLVLTEQSLCVRQQVRPREEAPSPLPCRGGTGTVERRRQLARPTPTPERDSPVLNTALPRLHTAGRVSWRI